MREVERGVLAALRIGQSELDVHPERPPSLHRKQAGIDRSASNGRRFQRFLRSRESEGSDACFNGRIGGSGARFYN
jgi:hypothetical protein